MAFLYIAEYAGMAASLSDSPPAIVPVPPLVVQAPIANAGAAVNSLPFNAQTRFVEVSTDSVCSIKFSPASAPVSATTSDIRLAANERKLVGVPNGAGVGPYLVSAILNT